MVSGSPRMGLGKLGWIAVRISAVAVLQCVFLIMGFWLLGDTLTFADWHGFLTTDMVQLSIGVALVGVLVHAWIGVWTVLTDYVKCSIMQKSLEFIFAVILLACLVWGLRLIGG